MQQRGTASLSCWEAVVTRVCQRGGQQSRCTWRWCTRAVQPLSKQRCMKHPQTCQSCLPLGSPVPRCMRCPPAARQAGCGCLRAAGRGVQRLVAAGCSWGALSSAPAASPEKSRASREGRDDQQGLREHGEEHQPSKRSLQCWRGTVALILWLLLG